MINLANLVVGAIQVACAGDVSPALNQLAWECAAGVTDSCMVELSAGECSLSETVHMCPGFELRGASENHTTLVAAPDIDAFHARRYGDCKDDGLEWHGRVYLERFTLRGPYVVDSSTATRGLFLEHLFHVERLTISYFTQGIRFEADVRRDVPSGANLWTLARVRIFNTFHAAFWVDGGDTNAGMAEQLWVTSPVCTQSHWDAELGQCAGIVDDGFLGSTYTAPHISGAGRGNRAFAFTNLNARHAVVGMYTEGGMLPGDLGVQSVMLGGLNSSEGQGLIIGPGRRVNGLVLYNDLDPANIAQLELGESTGMGGAFMPMRAHAISYSWPLRIKAEPSTNSFRFDVGNLNSAVPLRIVGNRKTAFDLGTARLRSSLVEFE